MNSFNHVFPVDPMLRQQRELWSVQNQRCYICGRVFVDCLPERHWLRPTKDHVFPRARYAGRRWNVLLAHRRCNHEKGSREPRPCEVLYLEAVNEILEWKRDERERAKSYEGDVWKLPVVG